MNTTHLTPAELDALLEAAKAATREEWMLQDSCSWRRIGTAQPYGDGNIICPVIQRGDNHPDLLARREDLEYIIAAYPATIERLVLMVRELQQRLEQAQIETGVIDGSACREEQEAGNGPCGICRYCLAGGAVEHFRARAVRAIEALEIDTTHDHFYLTGYYRARGDARYRIKSLPLVETEGE